MEADDVIESFIRTLMFAAGILGNNWLAIVSLPKKKSEIHTNEVLFINLAVSNLITNYLVDLPDTLADFVGRWFLGETFCGIFHFCADLSETSSIFTTLFISVFWHQKLVGSLRRGGAPVQLDNLRFVSCLLAGSWTLATVFSIPHFFLVSVEGTNESHEDCVDVFPDALSRHVYEITYLIVANVLPLAGILTASVQIVVTLLQNQKRVLSHQETIKGGNRNLKNTSVGTISTGKPASSGLNDNQLSQQSLSGTSQNDCRNLSRPDQMVRKPNSNPQVRAAKSVVAVASVVLICWLSHLLLRIWTNVHTSSLVLEVASYVAASYICIIPYIFLHGVKKLSCSCK